MEGADGFFGRINVQPVHQPRSSSTRCAYHANPDSDAGSRANLRNLEQQPHQI